MTFRFQDKAQTHRVRLSFIVFIILLTMLKKYRINISYTPTKNNDIKFNVIIIEIGTVFANPFPDGNNADPTHY